MIESHLSRRAVMAGGLAVATLSGCSGGSEDPDAADRELIARARNLSRLLRDALGTSPDMTRMSVLHEEQITQFDQHVSLATTAPSGSRVTAKNLRARELELARSMRELALQAQRGDVAALLASAAAGIEQALVQR